MSSTTISPDLATPVAPASAAASSGKRTARPRSKTRHRVLWVDDDPNITAAHARRLRSKGIEVIPASDGMQGYWQAVTCKPHLIVTDLRMPRWAGGDLLECLRSNAATAGIPLVVLSGYLDRELKRELYDLGVASVLEKPVDPVRLNKTLKRLLNRD